MPSEKIALVTGANGQDGYFLAKYLKRRGVGTVIGLVRPGTGKVCPMEKRKNLRYFDEIIELDLVNESKLEELITRLKPDFLFNFGAIAGSLTQQCAPQKLLTVNLSAVSTMLEVIKENKLQTTFIHASSSEIYAGGKVSPQGLDTPMVPRTIYGVTKVAADNLIKVYRESFGIKCYSVILFSHESPLRQKTFFTKRIICQALDIVEGITNKATVYSPTAVRDWGYAGDFCREIVEQALKGRHEDQIIATGVKTTVREFSQEVFRYLGLDYDTCVKEVSSLKGRASENIDVYASQMAVPVSFHGNSKLNVIKLIKLLIRFERNARNTALKKN